jgi:hypothetical protein
MYIIETLLMLLEQDGQGARTPYILCPSRPPRTAYSDLEVKKLLPLP